MDKLAVGRTFDYDIRSLLGYVAPLPPGQVTLLISGMTGGENWNSKGNGIHGLIGNETLVTTPGQRRHIWYYAGTVDKLWLFDATSAAPNYGPNPTSIYGWGYGYFLKWGTLIQSVNGGPAIGTGSDPSIGRYPSRWNYPSNAIFSTSVDGYPTRAVTMGTVNFTISLGGDWDRGNM